MSKKIVYKLCALIDVSIGSITWVMISTNKKNSTPMAKAFKKTVYCFLTIGSFAIGIPKKIVNPEIPPNIIVWKNVMDYFGIASIHF